MMEVLHHDNIPGCLLAFISYFLNWKKWEAKYLEYQKGQPNYEKHNQ